MMYIDELQDDNLFWVSMSIYINHFHLGGEGGEGMCVRFLDFGVPNMFPNMFPIVTIPTTILLWG